MIYDIVYLFLAFFSVIFYYKKGYKHFLILLFSVLSNVWGFCPSGNIKVYDWILVIIILTMLIGKFRSKAFFSIKYDSLGKMILVLLTYVLMAAILSPLRGVESLPYALMVARFDLFYLLYFVFRTIPINKFEEAVKPIILLSIINGVIYYLQYCGIFIMARPEVVTSFEDSRFNNIPIFSLEIFFLFFLLKGNGWKKVLSLFFWGGIIVGSQNRTMIFGVVLAIIVFVIYNYRKRLIDKKTIVILIAFGCFTSSYVAYRFSQKGSTGGGITSEIEMGYLMYQTGSYRLYDNHMIDTEGTLAFRFALILERVDYLTKHPTSFIFGAGSYHEKSISTHKLPFVLGSQIEDRIQKVDTSDVALLSHLFRYGLLFVVLYVAFIIKSVKICIKNNLLESHIYMLMIICFFGWAICGDVFFQAQVFIPVLVFMPYLRGNRNASLKRMA